MATAGITDGTADTQSLLALNNSHQNTDRKENHYVSPRPSCSDCSTCHTSLDFLGPLALQPVPGTDILDGRQQETGLTWTVSSNGSVIPTGDWACRFRNSWPGLQHLQKSVAQLLLLVGFAVRWITVPLMVTMVVAAVTVHLQNGWLAIAEGSGLFATPRTEGAIERLDRAKDILQQHGNYEWLTENGSFVVFNNGIEFAATYFIMLLALFFIGAGRYLQYGLLDTQSIYA